MIIKLDKIANTTIPNENTWFRLIQRLTFIIKLDRIIENNTTSKCMVQIGSLGPTFIIKLDRTVDTIILNQNACFRLFQGPPIH